MTELEKAKRLASSDLYRCDLVSLRYEKDGRRIYYFSKSKNKGQKVGLPLLFEVVNGKFRALSAEQIMAIVFGGVWPSWN